MKKMFKPFVVLAIFAMLVTACFPIGNPVESVKKVVVVAVGSYEDMIAKYQGGQKAASNGSVCVDTHLGKVDRLEKQVSVYLVADVEKTKAYRQAYNTSKADVEKAQQNYSSGSTGSLDLAELQKNGALPDKLGGGLTLMVNSLTEAPLAPVSEKVQLSLMDSTNEAFNSIQACMVDWNNAAEAYNITRNQVKGDVVGRVIEYLKIKELPQELPYYKGSGRAIK